MSTLRQRMNEAMVLRGFAERTKETYLVCVSGPNISTTAVSADKGYDSDELVKTIEASAAFANIPP